MHSLISICRLCLLLFVAIAVGQDPRFRTPDGQEQRTRQKPKWSHFFLMREPRSQESDEAEGFFYQVGSGPPIVNRLKSSPSGYQKQADDRGRYNPVVHSPYPNHQRTHQQFGSRMPTALRARLADKAQRGNPAGGIFDSATLPEVSQVFQSGMHEGPKRTEKLPEGMNGDAHLQTNPEIPEDTASKRGTALSRMQRPVSSHATLLLHGAGRKSKTLPEDSSQDFRNSAKRKYQNVEEPVFSIAGPRMPGGLPSHLTPIVPPAVSQPGKFSVPDETAANVPYSSDHEKLRPSIALHIPAKTENIPLVLNQNLPDKNNFGLRLSNLDNSARLNKDFVEKPESGISRSDTSLYLPYDDSEPLLEVKPENHNYNSGNEGLREREIADGSLLQDSLKQNTYGTDSTLVHDLPINHESDEPTVKLQEKQQLAEIRKQLEIGGWQSEAGLNSPIQDNARGVSFEHPQVQYGIRTESQREREFINHDFSKNTPYQTQSGKETTPPHLLRQKYNYLPVSRQHTQASSSYNPPNNVNFNTNIHVHPVPPVSDLQQEKLKQPTHSLSVHPYVFRRPDSDASHSTSETDELNSGAYNARIPPNQIYFLRPSNAAEVPLIIAEPRNLPYSQNGGGGHSGQTNIRTSRPSHLTAILPLSLGHSKENVVQGIRPSIYQTNPNERAPNVDYSDLLLRSQPQDRITPAVNPNTNTATHSISLLLPQQQRQFSERPTAVHTGELNRFQTHQVNLLPGSHGYVQTQVQLPPLNFRFHLTPVRDESNGSFTDNANPQPTVALDGNTVNLHPIPYQYRLPLQPIAFQGTHQVLFPNLQISNLPTVIPTVTSKPGKLNITKSTDAHADSEEKSKLIIESLDVGNEIENTSVSGNLSVRTQDTWDNTKEDISVKPITIDAIRIQEKSITTTTAPTSTDIQPFSSVAYSEGENAANISAKDDFTREVTTESRLPTNKPSSRLLSVMVFTEVSKTEDSVEIKSEGEKTTETKFSEEKNDKTPENFDNSTSEGEIGTTTGDKESAVREEDDVTTTDEDVNTDNEIPNSMPPSGITPEDLTVSSISSDSSFDTVSKNPSTESKAVHSSTTSVSRTGSESQFTTENVPASSENLLTTMATVVGREDILPIRTEMEIEIVAEPPETNSESEKSTSSSTVVTESPVSTEGMTTHFTPDITFSLTEPSMTDLPVETANDGAMTTIVAETEIESFDIDKIFQVDSDAKNIETRPTDSRENETTVSNVDASITTQSSAADASMPHTSISATVTVTSETDTANETTQFFTSPTTESSATSTPGAPVATESSNGKSNVISGLSVFTFTEGPVGKRKTVKGNVQLQDLKPEGNSEDNEAHNDGDETDTQPENAENVEDTTTAAETAVSKESEMSISDISVLATTPKTPEDNKISEERTKFTHNETFKDLNETNRESKHEFSESSKNHTIFTFVEKSISHSTEKKSGFSLISAASNTSTSTNNRPFVNQKSDETSTIEATKESVSHEAAATITSPEIEHNQSRVVVVSDSKDDTLVVRVISTVSNDRERNDNSQAALAEGDGSSTRSKEENSGAVFSDSEFIKEDNTNDKSGKAEISVLTNELQNAFTISNEISNTSDNGDFLISDSDHFGANVLSDLKNNNSVVFERSSNDTRNNEVPDSFKVDSGRNTSDDLNQGQGIPMTMDDEAFQLLLNDLVTPRNVTITAPVTSTSTSVSMEVFSKGAENTLNLPEVMDDELRSGNSKVLNKEEASITATERGAGDDLPEIDSGSSFFSKIFEKSLSPSHNETHKSPDGAVSEAEVSTDKSSNEPLIMSEVVREKNQNDSSRAGSSTITGVPNLLPEGQISAASVSAEVEKPVANHSSVKLEIIENFEGSRDKDISDFTEISKQHAR